MSTRRRFRRSHARHLSAEGRLPVDAYGAGELHQFLVHDAVRFHATDLPWAVAAYTRIGKLDGRGADAAYQRVVGEVQSLTGHGMPMRSGPVIGGPR